MISRIPPHVRWVGLVVGLLGMSVVIQVTAVIMSGGEPLGLVPDYERKAANWDAEADQRARNRALGWQVELHSEALPGGARLSLELLDGFGQPLDQATVSGVAFHNAHADTRIPIELPAVGEGRYESAVPFQYTGIHEFQLEVLREGQRFTAVVRDTVRVGG